MQIICVNLYCLYILYGCILWDESFKKHFYFIMKTNRSSVLKWERLKSLSTFQDMDTVLNLYLYLSPELQSHIIVVIKQVTTGLCLTLQPF